MLPVIVISVFLLLAYLSLIIYYSNGWKHIPEFSTGQLLPSVKLSVIIPARNECDTISGLLIALDQQSYPSALFEIIVVDDHSEDNTADLVRQFEKATLVQLSNEPGNFGKKKAIDTGIKHASGELIITTDADCRPGKDWLKTIAAFKEQTGAVFIAAPVVYSNNNSLLEIFQALDFLTLQGITGASVYRRFHNMCNGANLIYEKKVFMEVNGFEGIDGIASGDDMLLMQKITKNYPAGFFFLKSKDAVVETTPQPSWTGFFNQRKRWASKAPYYKDKRITAVLLLVYLLNLLFPVLFLCGLIINPKYLLLLAIMFFIKVLIEYFFVRSVAAFFSRISLMKYFILLQPLHIVYTIISGFLGQAGNYTWKGRSVK